MAVIELTKETFDREVVSASTPVLVDFWASWCGPCKMLSPVIHQLGDEVTDAKICKVNVDDQPELAAAFGVTTIPTLVVIQNGKEVDRTIGVQSKDSILKMLK